MMRSSWIVGVALLAGGACDKGGSGGGGMGKATGKLSSDETALFHDLPKGNQVMFGGNFLRMQKFLEDSPLGKMAKEVNQKTPGLAEWQSCFIEGPALTMLGGINYTGGGLDMRYVMKGLDLAGVEACAKKAGYPVVVDPDKKFISVDLQTANGPMKGAYIVLPDGGLYTHQAIPLGAGLGTMPASDRASIEADVAGLAKGTAADDTELVSVIEGLDRSRSLWIVGSAAGTPLADKVGQVSGTFDLGDGIHVDGNVQFKDAALANKLEQGVDMAKKQGAQLGPEIGDIIDNLKFERSGDKVHMSLAVSNKQLQVLADKVGPMMGRH